MKTLFLLLLFSFSFTYSKPLVLQLKWYHQFQFAGYYAALQKGFYKEEGLDIKIFEGQIGIDPAGQLFQEKADFAVVNESTFLSHPNLWGVMATFEKSPYMLASLHDMSHLAYVKKPLYVMSDLSKTAAFQMMFRSIGMSLKDVIYVPQTGDLKKLSTGEVDAIAIYPTHEKRLLQKMYQDVYFWEPASDHVGYDDILVVTEKFSREESQKIEKFKKASQKGWIYALENPNEIIDYILQLPTSRSQILTKEHLWNEYKGLNSYFFEKNENYGEMNKERWDSILKERNEAGVFLKPLKAVNILWQPISFYQKCFSIIISIFVVVLFVFIALSYKICIKWYYMICFLKKCGSYSALKNKSFK